MPVPAADSASAIAVLVLAWDEAAPAVRALVAAAQAPAPALDSILVLVPQADAPDQLSAEEYLLISLPAPAEPAASPAAAPAETTAPAKPAAPATNRPAPAAVTAPPSAPTETTATPTQADGPAAPELLLQQMPPRPPAALAWSGVRVLRLGSLSLPQAARRAGRPLPAPVWTGRAAAPAAPYLGALATTRNSDYKLTISESVSYKIITELFTPPAASPLLAISPAAPPALPQPVSPAATGLLYEPTEPIAGAADLRPGAASGLSASALAVPESSAFEPAAFELPAPALVDAGATGPVPPAAFAEASWSDALAALRHPAPEPAAAAPSASGPPHPALRPAAAHYPAADLNFQIIQYARFVVPLALAEAPFGAIYAPAWPTWLAAQELRYRTGRPLVLHVATLAATAAESVETATGWMAELQRQALHRADLILTETPALARRIRQELGLPHNAVRAVPAADAAAIAQALHGARPRPAGPAANPS